MGVKMKIWDSSMTEQEDIRLFQNKRKCTTRPCRKKVGLRVNTWFVDSKIPLLSTIFHKLQKNFHVQTDCKKIKAYPFIVCL